MTDSINSIDSTLSRLQSLYPRGSANLPGKSGVGQTLQADAGPFGSGVPVELSAGDLLETGNFGILRVQESLNKTLAELDTAQAAADQIDVQLERLDELAEAATISGLDAEARNAIEASFTEAVQLIDRLGEEAGQTGRNLLAGDQLIALAAPDGQNTISIAGADLSTGGSIVTVGESDRPENSSAAAEARVAVRQSRDNLQDVRSGLADASARLEGERQQTAILADGGNEVAAVPVPADSSGASELAGQIGEALGFSGLSVANAAPGSVLSLFRN